MTYMRQHSCHMTHDAHDALWYLSTQRAHTRAHTRGYAHSVRKCVMCVMCVMRHASP
jgi:hypothetical protein